MEYRYQAVDSQGQVVSGRVVATGEREAARQVRERDLTILEIEAAASTANMPYSGRRRANLRDKAIVIRELSVLLTAGVSLAEAVQSLSEAHMDSDVGEALARTHARLRAGERFSAGFRSSGMEWPEYVHQLVLAGEETGKFGQALNAAADQMEYDERVRGEIRTALLYPSILVVSGVLATLIIFVVVVPKFAAILRTNRAQVPDISLWVLSAGLFVREHLLWIAMLGVLLVAVAARTLASPDARARALESLCRVPRLGSWLVETEIGRWAAMLGTLLNNRVPILRAMELAQQGVRFEGMRNRLAQSLRDVRGGRKFAEAVAGARLLNQTGLNLIRVGERSGELAPMLSALATLHENAGRERMRRFLILLEPVAILVIGGVIGIIMASVMLAITSLGNVPL